MGIVWQVTPEQAFTELVDAYENEIHDAIKQIADRYAPDIEAWMKSNAPWTDRTGNARQTLNTEVQEVASIMVGIILAHGVDYGVFLELSHGGLLGHYRTSHRLFCPKSMGRCARLFK